MRTRALLLLPALLAGLAACGGGAQTAAPGGSGTAAPPGGALTGTALPTPGAPAPGAAASCPPPPAGTPGWPDGVPADLPQPPGTSVTSSSTAEGGLRVVRFTTADSLRNGVLFVVRALPPAGFAMGRGDAEAAEADAPFSRGDLRGVYRMISRDACTTDWLLALTTAPSAGGGPLLPTPTGSPSPLPFG